ncbi:1-acyl-sn-glycerol-3-phosphate acyltransferase [Leptospira idonii]|uniref:lysophospholipid acyltransferase family protein n=1 Tax=Leptospira idonii TaxID=1193500 RepID=UPI00319E66FC
MYYLGRTIGFVFMWCLIKPMRLIYGNKKCTYENEHILKEFKGKSAIIVSNHIKPRNKFLRLISMPYDAFMIRHLLKKNGIYSTAMTSYDSGKRNKSANKLRPGQVRKEQLIKGIVKSMDLIPLNRNESDPATIKEIKKRIDLGNLGLGIFPEGTWFRGFRKSRRMHGGMAVLSKRYNLPILPVYIEAYNLNQPLRIAVGNPIWEPMEASQVTEYISKELLRLKERRPVDVGPNQLQGPTESVTAATAV